jgi:hypothetical protein
MPAWKKVIVSGSDAALNSLYSPSITGSLLGTASFANTASYVTTLNQNVLITGSAAIGTSSLGANENTLTLGARDSVNEGGQLGLNAPGGTYTSASMIDVYQNRLRILRGTNAGSDAEYFNINLHTGQVGFSKYTGSGAFPGTAAGYLGVDSGGNVITTTGTGGGGSGATFNGGTNVNNRLITATGGTPELNGEAALTFDGSALTMTGSFNISGSIFNPNSIHFYTTASGVTQVGQLGWDDGYGTLDLMLKGGNVNVELGQENVVLVYNGNGTTLNKGEVVFVSGSQGNRPAVNRAIGTTDGYSATTLGFAAEPIPAGAEGYVTTFGFINNINTSGTIGGSPVWLSPTTPGGWTTTKPQAPQHTVLLGYIVRVHNTVGSIFTHISNGWEIGELHDVRETTTTSSFGDLLVKSGSVWISGRQLTGSYGLTGSLLATSFTGSLLGTASFATSASYAPDTTFPYTGSARITGSLGVTGSLSILESGVNSLNTTTYTLRGPNASSSVDWNSRRLSDSAGERSIEWSNRLAYDSSPVLSINWGARIAYDGASSSSIEWNARQLKDGFGTIAADWSFGRRELYDRYTTASINWDIRELYNSSNTVVVEWENQVMSDPTAIQSIDWNSRQLFDSNGKRSVLWRDRIGYDANESSSIDWENRITYDSVGKDSVNWQARQLINTGLVPTVDWENTQLFDGSTIESVNWNTRRLFDAASATSIDWVSRGLFNSVGDPVLYYDPLNNQGKTIQFSYHQNQVSIYNEGESLIAAAVSDAALNSTGELISYDASIDPTTLRGELCSLGEDGIWYTTDQASISGSAMLSICVAAYNKGVMMTEGTITVVTASGYTDIPFVEGTSFYGKPVYIRSGSLGGLTTTKPTSGYVRVVGHMYYNSTTYTDYWLMKFRPSNDWYQI